LQSNQRQLQHQQANLLGQLVSVAILRVDVDGALRFSTQGARIDLALPVGAITAASLPHSSLLT
jgi:hypothetical protein